MTIQLIRVRGEEFIRKILVGERDFSGIALEDNFDLSGSDSFDEMQRYLQSQNLKEQPLHIEGSRFRQIKASGVYLPYTIGHGADFFGSVLRRVNLVRGRFNGTDFDFADFAYANLEKVDFSVFYGFSAGDTVHTRLWKANLQGSNIKGTDFEGANLECALLYRAERDEKTNFNGAKMKGTDVQRGQETRDLVEELQLRDFRLARAGWSPEYRERVYAMEGFDTRVLNRFSIPRQ